MKRKSSPLKVINPTKVRLSKDKHHLLKKNNNSDEKEEAKPNPYLFESTPGSTRSKEESSLLLSKTKTNPQHSISLHLSQEMIEEDIPDDQYNEMLKEISRSLNFDMPSKEHKKPSTIKDFHQKKYEKYPSFQYDHNLHKEITIEILIELNENNVSKQEYYNEIANEIKKELTAIENFVYYEFSNIQNISMSNYSKIDYANYYNLFQKKQIMNEKTKRDIKEINLLTALSSLYQRFLHEDNSSFYFITPMHAFLFSNLKRKEDDVNESDINALLYHKQTIAVLSNTLLLDKQLQSNRIQYAKITPSKKPRSETDAEADYELNMDQFDKEKYNNDPALVEGYYITILYNMMIDEYENKTFNLISPFPFEGSTFRENKIKVDSYVKRDKSVYVICINVFGCIFESKLKSIIKLLSKKNSKTKLSKTQYTYSMKLEKIEDTCEFFALNTNLSRSIERVEYKDNEYYLK